MKHKVGNIVIDFDGDYGYELSPKQQENVKQVITEERAKLLTAYEIAHWLAHRFGDYVRIERKLYVLERGYLVCTVYREGV